MQPRDEGIFNEQWEAFKKLVFASYDHVNEHPEKEPVVDRLVEFVSDRFTTEPNFAVVIAIWNAMNNCVDGKPVRIQ
jgi:hypothetical protein